MREGHRLFGSNYMMFPKRQSYADTVAGQGLGRGEGELLEHRGILGQWNYDARGHGGRYMCLHVPPRLWNVHHQARSVM